MLGIIFTGGNGPDSSFVKRIIETETKDALFIAADSGLLAAENAGVRPHWIAGDMDSLQDISRLASYPKERVKRYKHDKDFTDTEIAFTLALENGAGQIWIIGGGGGRIDHLFGIRSLFERDIFPLRWITDEADIRCIDAKINPQLAVSMEEKNAIVSVFPVGIGPWQAESTGLKWSLSGFPWNRGSFGLSNVALECFFSIEVQAGRFLVILPQKTNAAGS